MTIAGMVIALSLMPVGIVMGWDHSFEPAALCWAALALLALLVSAIGCFTMRFESVGAANKTLQATAAAPGN
jgi:hypothetical protein